MQKPAGEQWYVVGEEGENILCVLVPTQLSVPMWNLKADLSTYVEALIDAHTVEEGCPPARIIQFIRPSDGTLGLAAGGRSSATPVY